VPRLTRVASQARTRAQLIETAREMFLRDGYFATSLDKVADAAGYSKGAVYSNFASKDELCLAVLDALLTERAGEIALAVAGRKRFAGKLAAFENWATHALGDEGWITLEIEFASQARANPELRTAFAERAGAIRSAIALMLKAGAQEAGGQLPLPAEELATTVLSVGLGLAVQRAFDPAVSVRTLTNTIRVIVGLPIRPPTKQRRRRPVRPVPTGPAQS
jgi:AcrR family transcriptional regulator